MKAPHRDEIRRVLLAHPPGRSGFSGRAARPWASVALALAGGEDSLHLAMILRAEREGDPWSGQMALPGGRADAADPDAAAVAERETREEVGLVLAREQLIAPLDEMPVVRRGVDTGMVLVPHVYDLGAELGALVRSPEVADAWWVPLTHLLDPAQATEYRYTLDGTRLRFDAIAFEGQVIWGLTHRVLTAFFARLGRALPRPE